jgi:hypothetical protein
LESRFETALVSDWSFLISNLKCIVSASQPICLSPGVKILNESVPVFFSHVTAGVAALHEKNAKTQKFQNGKRRVKSEASLLID